MLLAFVGIALAALSLGAVSIPVWLRLAAAGLLAMAGWRCIEGGVGRPRRFLAALVMPALMAWSLWLQPRPSLLDPVHRIPAGQERSAALSLVGSVAETPRPWRSGEGCSAVLAVRGGRTALSLKPCPPDLRAGSRLRVTGELRRPLPAAHPLLDDPADRLSGQGIWTRMTPQRIEGLGQRPAPLAALRLRIASALIGRGGEASGGLLAALVLGGAVVPLPEGLTTAFRAAGLSHALAASGFHLSVLLGAAMALGRHLPVLPRRLTAAGTLLLFLMLAGPQPSVVRAVLMGGAALLAMEASRRTRPIGVLMLTLLLMALVHPPWLRTAGFQLSAAATAGLICSAGPLQRVLAGDQPSAWRRWLAPAVAVPVAASLWTLPLQLWHFGTTPLYAIPANLLVTPLLAPLTIAAAGLALVALVVPPLLGPLATPVLWGAALLRHLVSGLAALPAAQLHTGRPASLLVGLLVMALIPWLLEGFRRWRPGALAMLAAVVLVHAGLLWSDQVLLVHRFGQDWLLARHHGRAALVATTADERSCRLAGQLVHALGHQALDWVVLHDPVPAPDMGCWEALSAQVLSPAHGRRLGPGQRLHSDGLEYTPLSAASTAALLRLGGRPWLLLPDRPALLSIASAQAPSPPVGALDGLWLGAAPSVSELAWLDRQPHRRLWLSGAPPSGGAPNRRRGALGEAAHTGVIGSLMARL
ncbi:ComEC family competence protein [Synechococcus sp. RSCCF101]|uniref:ComEC/Rec2 family competence protein n=1 Tax=Synechococcus sp. RSCCF101 TaxID=2511069 RepID=UPI001244FA80|nr:ComEC/Rec2 family competence protein [Synechococcus sp. RSCCF101]QEY33226.1 ComEC family competence protein [Synechococcus sp. RSCCF101]